MFILMNDVGDVGATVEAPGANFQRCMPASVTLGGIVGKCSYLVVKVTVVNWPVVFGGKRSCMQRFVS